MSEMSRAEREAAARAYLAAKDSLHAANVEMRRACDRLAGSVVLLDSEAIVVGGLHNMTHYASDLVIDLRTTDPSDAAARLAALVADLREWLRDGRDWNALRAMIASAESPAPVAHPAEARIKELEGLIVEAFHAGDLMPQDDASGDQWRRMRAKLSPIVDAVGGSTMPKPAPAPGEWIDGRPTHEGVWERRVHRRGHTWTVGVWMNGDGLRYKCGDLCDSRAREAVVEMESSHQSRYVGPLPEGGDQ